MIADCDDLAAYAARARAWLEDNAELRKDDEVSNWAEGSDDVSVFRDLPHEAEAALLADAMDWQRRKFDAGWGAITWPVEYGGAGLSPDHERIFSDQEANFVTPPGHEVFSVTVRLVAPTVATFGGADQRERFVRPFLRTEELCCQLFSEPGAGSDLAGVTTKAVRDGDSWVVDGQKVWSSGAQFARWGELLCRTDTAASKHGGLTMFLVPMESPGITVRPIRQMSGGSSFNEVFLDSVRVPDSLRLGDEGQGWRVTLATLAFERAASSGQNHDGIGGTWSRVLSLARWLGAGADPVLRQRLAHLYTSTRIRELQMMRAAAADATGTPGPAGSLGKLQWTQWMTEMSEVVSALLGPRLAADSGEWGTWAWSRHVLGAPGYRIAGGSDEIQRNIIAERVLGLPAEPRPDRDAPFNRSGR